LAGLLFIAPSIARAQSSTTGAIAGIVKDTTGAVLPGVTVEASSPVLIEKTRSVVSDGAGLYKVTDLRPGTYNVTFTLPGFASVKREGLELTVGFTATVNAEMRVGGVAETIVVSGQTPVVDVQNVRTERVLTREVIDTIPTAKSIVTMGALIPGMVVGRGSGTNQDVGGTAGDTYQAIMIHGGHRGDQQTLMDGMNLAYLSLAGGGMLPSPLGDGTMDQITLEVSGHSAEAESGGVIANMIPKQGGNTYKGTVFGNFANKSMQSDNYSAELKAQGLAQPQPIERLSDFNPAFGGPIVRDKLWFFTAFRDLYVSTYLDPATRGYNVNPSGWKFVPDLSQTITNPQHNNDAIGRGTWQLNPKNKISVLYDFNRKYEPRAPVGTLSTEQSTFLQIFNTHLEQITWSAPLTNRLLVDAGVGIGYINHVTDTVPDAVWPAATETTTGLLLRATNYGAATQPLVPRQEYQYSHFLRGSVSYVTGTHALKIGATHYAGNVDVAYHAGADYQVSLFNGAPTAVTYLPTPFRMNDYLGRTAVYGQDQWTLKRFTLNLGLRLDNARSHYPDYSLAATNILPARSFPGADVLNWTDLSPRLGVSWDVFGNGKTALKASANRYVLLADQIGLTRSVDPVNAAGGLLTRTWNDANGDFVPQGDPLNPLANGELGPSPNQNFGKSVLTLTYDPNWSRGFDTRDYQWEFSTAVQQEIMPGMSVNAAYFRRIFGNFAVTDNTLVAASDYDSFCVTSPVDPRLPGGGGNQICGFRDLNPSKLGRVQNQGTNSNAYGSQYEHWNGVDVGVNARLGAGTLIQGGISTGKTVTDNCAVFAQVPEAGSSALLISTFAASPLAGPYCHQETPFLTQFKLIGSYVLPYALQVSGAFQSIPNDPISAAYVATNAEIVPTLGRNLSAGPTSTTTVQIIPPGTLYGSRVNQLDLRFSRTFNIHTARLKAMFDVYNVGNVNTVLQWNNTYGRNGATWLTPSVIVAGRVMKIGAQFDF
jgi:hypothetical protein